MSTIYIQSHFKHALKLPELKVFLERNKQSHIGGTARAFVVRITTKAPRVSLIEAGAFNILKKKLQINMRVFCQERRIFTKPTNNVSPGT